MPGVRKLVATALVAAWATLGASACGGGTTRTLTAKRIQHPVPTFVAGTFPTTTTAPPTTSPPPTTASPPVTVPREATISQGEYDLISNGMPYAQVVTIVGGPGTLVSQRTMQTPNYCSIFNPRGPCPPPYYATIQDYQWAADNGGQALITFTDGRVSAKTQSGP